MNCVRTGRPWHLSSFWNQPATADLCYSPPANEQPAMARSKLGTSFGHIDPSCAVWLWQRVMYDLCTRPEQPEPAPAHAEMESREVAEALGRQQQQQQELRRTEEQDTKQHGLSDKTVPTTAANISSTSLLGKRHHSLYANLNGFEVEGIRKVSVDDDGWMLDEAWRHERGFLHTHQESNRHSVVYYRITSPQKNKTYDCSHIANYNISSDS